MRRRIIGFAAESDNRVNTALTKLDNKLRQERGFSVRQLPRDIYLWCAISMILPIAAVMTFALFIDLAQLNDAIKAIDRTLPRVTHLTLALVIAAHIKMPITISLRRLHEILDFESATNPNKTLGDGYRAWGGLIGLVMTTGVGLAWIITLLDIGSTLALGIFAWLWLMLITSQAIECWKSFLTRTNRPRRRKRLKLPTVKPLHERLAELNP